MIRTGQIPEYVKYPALGTYSSLIVKNPLSGMVVDIEDNILINDEIILYLEREDGTQEDIVGDSNNIIIDLSKLKKDNHTISLDNTQTLNTFPYPKWTLTINVGILLRKYIFYRLKESRTFEGIENFYTTNNNINDYINDFIENNILNRYNFSRIDLYIEYDKGSVLNPKWEPELKGNKNKISNYGIDYNNITEILTIKYTQIEYPSIMKYYFNLIWDRT